MSSSLVRSTYRRMMKYFLRHWCMEIKCDGNKNTNNSTSKRNGQDNCQTKKNNRKKAIDRFDDEFDVPPSDAQLEWEHEQGIDCSPKMCRRSEPDLFDIFLTPTSQSSTSMNALSNPDFEWDALFDYSLTNHVRCCFVETVK